MEIYQAELLSHSINLIINKKNIIELSLTPTKKVIKWGSIFGTNLLLKSDLEIRKIDKKASVV